MNGQEIQTTNAIADLRTLGHAVAASILDGKFSDNPRFMVQQLEKINVKKIATQQVVDAKLSKAREAFRKLVTQNPQQTLNKKSTRAIELSPADQARDLLNNLENRWDQWKRAEKLVTENDLDDLLKPLAEARDACFQAAIIVAAGWDSLPEKAGDILLRASDASDSLQADKRVLQTAKQANIPWWIRSLITERLSELHEEDQRRYNAVTDSNLKAIHEELVGLDDFYEAADEETLPVRREIATEISTVVKGAEDALHDRDKVDLKAVEKLVQLSDGSDKTFVSSMIRMNNLSGRINSADDGQKASAFLKAVIWPLINKGRNFKA